MDINELLKSAHSLGASDLHIKVGSNPILRIDGALSPMTAANRFSQEDTLKIAFSVMSPGQREIFKKRNDIDLAYSVPGLGRFRCNIFIQRRTIGLVFRVIPMKIPTVEELLFPDVLKKISMEPRGLILVTYGTRATKCLTLSVIVLVLACLVFALWSLLRTPAAESAVEFLAYTTNATGLLATFRLTSGFRWPIRYSVATQTNLPNGHPTLNPPLPAFTNVPQKIAPGKSGTFSVTVPDGERHWVVVVGARKVTGPFDDLCMAVHRSLYRAKFWLPVNLDSFADKIPNEKVTTHILVGPEMRD